MVGSKTFHLRLLELLAVSCHQIAVHLYRLDGVNHKHYDYQRWVDEPRDMSKWESYRDPTPFCHMAYTDVDQYPDGAADTAGYWAEAKIFGGVLVFDRGETELEVSRVMYTIKLGFDHSLVQRALLTCWTTGWPIYPFPSNNGAVPKINKLPA